MKNPLFRYDSSECVFRGGCGYDLARYSRVFLRRWRDASYRDSDLSFRLFRSQERS